MNYIIDIGNTRVKIYLFKKEKILSRETVSESKLLSKVQNDSKSKKIDFVIFSSVTKDYKKELTKIFKNSKVISLSDKNLQFPFKNNYKSISSLGDDRKALSSAAVFKYPNLNNLVIDLGSCITYDFIDSSNNYFGGAISPGLSFRYRSLSEFTFNLPSLEFKYTEKNIGTNTEESIHIGVSNGIISEVNRFINNLKTDYPDLNVIITGGDSMFLLNKIKNAIFADQDFLAIGLNNIIKLNND